MSRNSSREGRRAPWDDDDSKRQRRDPGRTESRRSDRGTAGQERKATDREVKRTTAPRDLQREGDILRWRILHYQHSFDHIRDEAALPLAITGTTIAEANAEEMRRARTFEHWRGNISIHTLRSDFWVMALSAVAQQESDAAAQRANAAVRANYQDYLNGGLALGLGR